MLKTHPTRISLLAAATTLLVASTPLLADEYEVFIDISNEEDLYDLQVEGQIGEDTFNALRELIQRGIDLNTANREQLYSLPNLSYVEVDAILAYRAEAGGLHDPAALVINSVLSERKLAAIAPFLVVRQRARSALGATGYVRTQTRWSVNDSDVPPFALQARTDALQKLRIGVAALLTRNDLGDVVYDPSRDALTATETEPRADIPKFYAQWEDADFGAIIGTYRIGFGQRLTFDVTDQPDPNGFYGDDEVFRDTGLTSQCKESAGELAVSPCSGAAGEVHVTPDFRSRESLLGVAVGLKELKVGRKSSIAAHGFGSYQPKGVYQYAIYDAGKCSDPRDDEDPNCGAPDTFRTQDNAVEPTSRFSFHTLPNMYAELLGGGNVTLNLDRRSHIGVTGYGSYINWLVEGIDLDFQEWARTPFGGSFGAVGVNGHYGVSVADIFAEVTRSFDSQIDGGGGFGGIVRSVTSWQKNQIEVSARYYDEKFANPYARPISAADQFDGLRARDELGFRIRTSSVLKKKFSVRTSADIWRAPNEKVNEAAFYIRGDVDIFRDLRLGLWTAYQDKELFDGNGPQCFSISSEDDENGEPIPCGGEKYSITGRVRYKPIREVTASLQYTHEIQDDEDLMDDTSRYRQDASITATVIATPIEQARVRARLRILDEEFGGGPFYGPADPGTDERPFGRFLGGDDNEETSVWLSVDFSYRLRVKDRLRLRYDLIELTDNRMSTLDREPSPEHWLWLEYTAWF